MSTQLIQSFSRKWADSTQIQPWSASQYQAGWGVIGATPPEVAQFDALHNIQDKKIEWLFNQFQEYALEKNITIEDASTFLLKEALKNAGVSTIYDPQKQYRSGEICFFADDDSIPNVGNYYECYHQNGCKNKDPRDAMNRPDGWTDTDISKPYFWKKIGPWFEAPPVGGLIHFQTDNTFNQYMQWRGDAQLHKKKYWRLALRYPDLVNGDFISLAEIRGEIIRNADLARGVDANRTVGSWQEDAIRNITGKWPVANLAQNDWGIGAVNASSSSGSVQSDPSCQSGALNSDTGSTEVNIFDASNAPGVKVANENRMRNVAFAAYLNY